MTRNDCEQAIMTKLREIRDIAGEYMGREPERNHSTECAAAGAV